ncbi:hypothetical protein AAF712_011436 [Marasmius tenuissimus]|uniref:Uncharacterized protein n=1 Tax=Marasmius tenuissimus TaxID=585030 RepID=A0ABR2ZLB1_9AGAR
MGHPKKYNSPEERRAAARLYAKSHYNRNRTNILENKKTKRVQSQHESEAERAAERRRRQAERKKATPTSLNNVHSAGEDDKKQRERLFRDSLKSIEATIEDLKSQFLKVIRPTRRQYFDRLCIQIEEWIEDCNRFRGTIHHNPSQSPLVPAIKYVESMLDEYHSIKDEYFYLLRDKNGPKWDWKRDDCTAFKDVAIEVLQALEDIEAAMKDEEFEERAIEGELLYQDVFPY